MKYFIALIVCLIAFTIFTTPAFAPPEPTPEDDFRYSDHVITGKIILSEIIVDPREDNSATTFRDTIIYQIQVLEWHKNPLEKDIITVSGTHFPNDVIQEPEWGVVEFEIGDIVYLYIDETDDGLRFREYSSKLLQENVAELTPPHDPYTDDELLRLASEKKYIAEESMGGGSGMGFFDASNFQQSTIVIPIIVAVGSAFGLTYYLRKRK